MAEHDDNFPLPVPPADDPPAGFDPRHFDATLPPPGGTGDTATLPPADPPPPTGSGPLPRAGDYDLLEEIARRTGGEVVAPSRLSRFVESLNQKKAPIVETYSYPLWHKPLVLALALGCFVGEWGLRRLKGLA